MSHNQGDSFDLVLLNKIEKKLEFFVDYPIISLIIIGVIGVFLRVVIFEPEIHIRQDANAYFWYAMDMSILKNFPFSAHTNDGWSMALSVIFSIANFNNYLDYTIIQRIFSMAISIATIIPLYFLCRKFFNSTYSLLGVSLFVFEPHIIQNSILGLTEPLYIFLVVCSFVFILSKNQKFYFYSFLIIGFCTIVRAEGIIVLPILLTTLFIKNGANKNSIFKFIIALSLFALIFVSFMIIKAETSGNPSTAMYITNFSLDSAINPDERGINFSSIEKGITTLGKKLGQTMVPYFVLFVPFGIIFLFKNMNKNNLSIFLMLCIYTFASIRMFMVVQDSRLILVLVPFFSIFSVFTIQYLGEKNSFEKIFLVSILGAIILLSWFFLYSTINYEYEKESVRFSEYVVENVKVSNNFYPESGYVYGSWVITNIQFPSLSSSVEYNGPELLDYKKNSWEYIDESAKSIEEYILLARDQGLTHLIVDGTNKRTSYFNDLYYNEEKYNYLIKEFDSMKEDFRFYHVKVFRISYELFDSFQR